MSPARCSFWKPNDWQVHQDLGLALAQLGNVRGAEEQFRMGVILRPDSAMLHYNLGVALHLQGRTEEAAQHYREALRIDPAYKKAQAALEAAGDHRR